MSDLWTSVFSWDGPVRVSPALIAIAAALLSRRVVPSLGLGVLCGALVASRGAPLDAAARVVAYVGSSIGVERDGEALAFRVDHLEISLFSVVVAAAVAVMSAAGATRALVQVIERLAASRRGAMVSSWLAGTVVFFDDYANCLVVGNAMGPMCDRYQVSRAKLAYIVDSTAAPIASLALVSTWVGYEVGLIADALAKVPGADASAFTVFVGSVPYRFYSLFTLVFVGAIAWSGRDFGPMREAEARVRAKPAVDVAPSRRSPWLAAAPVGLLVLGTLGWLGVDGSRTAEPSAAPGLSGMIEGVANVLGAANPYHAMLFGSVLCLLGAAGGALATGALDRQGTARACGEGARQVAGALVVLFLAWTLSAAMADTGADAWIASALDGRLPAWALPAVTFTLSAFTAFATGTSFGTMAILIPMALPVALQLSPDPYGVISLATTSAILSGSCLGDHASPISDTTVLSALGSGASLVEHVRTQLPYALTTGLISLLCYVPLGLGAPWWLLLPAGSLACVGVVYALGSEPAVQSGEL